MTTAQIQILDACEERLNNLRSSNRGYHRVYKRVDRGRQRVYVSGDIPAINFYAPNDRLVSKAAGFEFRALTVIVEAHELDTDKPFMDVASELAADVITALWRDPDAPRASDRPSLKLGDIVDSLTVTDAEYLPEVGQEGWSAARVTIEVQYEVEIGKTVLWEQV